MTQQNIISTKKNNFFLTALVLAVVTVISIVSKFSLVLSVQTGIFLILLTSSLFLLNNYKIKLNSYVIPSELFLICCCVSYMGADFQVNARDYLFVLLSALLAGFNVTFLSAEMKKKFFIVPIFISLWLSMILFTRFISDPQRFFTVDDFYEAVALNINVIAGFLVLVYPLFFIYIKEKTNTKVFTAMMLFVLTGIVLTRSRIAILAAFVLTVIFLFQYKNKYVKFLAWLLGIVFLAGIIYISFLKSDFHSFSERLIWWKTAYLIFKENIFFGAGFGSYSVLFKTFRPELVLNTLFAHNIIMQLLADTGIFGLLSFAGIIVSFYVRVIDGILEDINTDFYIVPALSVTAFLFVNLLDYSFFVPANMMVFFIILCSVFFCNPQPNTGTKKINIYILAVLILYIGAVIVKPVIAQIHFKKGIRFYIAEQYEMAVEEFEKASDFDKKNPEYYIQISKSYFALYDKKRNEAAQMYADKAVEYNKKASEFYKNSAQIKSYLSSIYWNIDEKEQAVAVAREALKYDKYNPNLQEYLQKITVAESLKS